MRNLFWHVSSTLLKLCVWFHCSQVTIKLNIILFDPFRVVSKVMNPVLQVEWQKRGHRHWRSPKMATAPASKNTCSDLELLTNTGTYFSLQITYVNQWDVLSRGVGLSVIFSQIVQLMVEIILSILFHNWNVLSSLIRKKRQTVLKIWSWFQICKILGRFVFKICYKIPLICAASKK